VAWRRSIVVTTAVCWLAAGCGNSDHVDLSTLNVGTYSTIPRAIPDQPSLPNGAVLEGLRMSDAVADTSQFSSPLIHLEQAGPVTDTAGIVAIVGEAGGQILVRRGWIVGYSATYADTPRLPNGDAPAFSIELSVTLLRFPDDAAAQKAASALEVANWSDFGKTIAAPLPKHPEIAARYTPGIGALHLDTPMGPFVLRLKLRAPSDGIEKRIGELDAVIDEEHALLRRFTPTPVTQIQSLARDPDGLLARMVATDPTEPPPPSPAFAVYGPTGALRDQLPTIRRDRLYETWGVDRFAVSGDQRLYRLRDNPAAEDMAAFVAESAGADREIESESAVPGTRCFRAGAATPDMPAYSCSLVFDNVYTEVRAVTEANAEEMAAAQYALLATR
jgi:hypothetical protein